MSEIDPVEAALARFGVSQEQGIGNVIRERPVDLDTIEGKIEFAEREEKKRRKKAAEIIFGMHGLSDPTDILESWSMINSLNRPGFEQAQYVARMKVTVNKLKMI